MIPKKRFRFVLSADFWDMDALQLKKPPTKIPTANMHPRLLPPQVARVKVTTTTISCFFPPLVREAIGLEHYNLYPSCADGSCSKALSSLCQLVDKDVGSAESPIAGSFCRIVMCSVVWH
jgi:hypothetical protein